MNAPFAHAKNTALAEKTIVALAAGALLGAAASLPGAVLSLHVPSTIDPPVPPIAGVFEIAGDEPVDLPVLSDVLAKLSTTVHVLVDGPADLPPDGVALIAFVRRNAGMTLDDFRRHGLDIHGPMDALMPGLLRYEQCITRDEAYRGAEPAFDCVSIFHFPSLETLMTALGAPGSAESAADLANFVDLPSARVLVARPSRVGA